MDLTYVLTGGFLKGYRTYIMAALGVLTAVIAWAVGDMDLVNAVHAISVSLGVGTVRAAIPVN